MQIKFELKIGNQNYTIIEDAADQTEFFRKMSFFSSLPTVGPNGETDLVLRHRVAGQKQGKEYNYYSVVSEQAGMEFNLGQYLKRPGEMYPKGWAPLYKAQAADTAETAESYEVDGGLGTNVAAPTPAPAQTQTAPAPRAAAPKAAAPKATTAPAAQAATPQTNQQVSNVLARFGI